MPSLSLHRLRRARRNAAVLPILTVACLAAGSSPASATSLSGGSLNYAAGTTSTAGMLDVGMVLNTVAADMAGTQRNYDAAFPDDSAGGGFAGPRVATVKLSQKFGTPVVRTISAQVPSTNIVDVQTGAGVSTSQLGTSFIFETGGGGWTPGRSYRLRVRQIARPSGGRRFRVSVANVATGGERVIVDFTRNSLTALSLRSVGSVSANNASTCSSLYNARASIDRPRGVRGSDHATIAATASPAFTDARSVTPSFCPASQRRVSTDRIVIDLGR